MTRRPDPASPGYRTGAAIARAAQALGLQRPALRAARWVVARWASPEQRAHIDELEQQRQKRQP